MKEIIVPVITAFVLTACSTQPAKVTLLPRGAAKQGAGQLDRVTRDMTVRLEDGRVYSGRLEFKSLSSSNNDATAILLSAGGGQMNCNLSWSPMIQTANGTCVDNQNNTYDVTIRD
jgi:hypothetical protein